jgi:hypothetical protein
VRRPNSWHTAICAQLAAEPQALAVEQIWRGMEDAGFKHQSVVPRSTLGARIAELVRMKRIERTGLATYRLRTEEHS